MHYLITPTSQTKWKWVTPWQNRALGTPTLDWNSGLMVISLSHIWVGSMSPWQELVQFLLRTWNGCFTWREQVEFLTPGNFNAYQNPRLMLVTSNAQCSHTPQILTNVRINKKRSRNNIWAKNLSLLVTRDILWEKIVCCQLRKSRITLAFHVCAHTVNKGPFWSVFSGYFFMFSSLPVDPAVYNSHHRQC